MTDNRSPDPRMSMTTKDAGTVAPKKVEVQIETQIAAVRREIALRRKLYPGWIENRRLSQKDADDEIAAMEAVHATLTDVQTLRHVRFSLDVLQAGELEATRKRVLGE